MALPLPRKDTDCNGPCSTSTSAPTYAPKIERCTIGSMTLIRPKPVTTPKTGIGFLDAVEHECATRDRVSV